MPEQRHPRLQAFGGPWLGRLGRTLAWTFAAAIVFFASYLLAVNALLLTGGLGWLLNQLAPELKFESGRTFSPWFFRFELRDARLSVMDTDFHLELKAPRGSIQIRLDQLFQQQFQLAHFKARDVTARLRPNYRNDLPPERRRALPDLPDAEPPLIEEVKDPEKMWGYRFENVDITFDEIWISEFRYLGDSEFNGGFLFQPKRRMALNSSEFHLAGGELRFGAERRLAKPVAVSISGRVPPFPANNPPPWDETRLKAHLQATWTDPSILNVFLNNPGSSPVQAGQVETELRLSLEDDVALGHMHTSLENLELSLGTLRAVVHGVVSGRFKGRGSQLPSGTVEGALVDASLSSSEATDVDVDDWRFRVDLPELFVQASPLDVHGPFFVSTEDARPAAQLLGLDTLPEPLEQFLSLPDLGAVGRLRLRNGGQEIHLDRATSDTLDVRGRLVLLDEQAHGAALLMTDTLSVGIEKAPDDTSISPLANDEWLEERLSELPDLP